MDRNNRKKIPGRTDREYVIYFYESGLSDQYRQRQKDIIVRSNYGPSAQYDFSSDLFSKRPWPVPQTVEDVVRNGYFSIPRSEPETAIISDKKHTSKLGLDDIIGQIRHRYQVYQQNIDELEVSKCSAINSFYSHEAYHGPPNDKIEYSVSKRLDKLYIEQREERVTLWRDISRLKLQLPETAQLYLSAYRKVSILEDTEGDGL